MKSLVILGATGSIGRSTLQVVRESPEQFKINGLAAGGNAADLAEAAREFKPAHVAIADPGKGPELRERLAGTDCRVHTGPEGVLACVRECGARLCVSAAVGFAGLLPTLAALEAGQDVALANKECLVAAGELVTALARSKGCRLLPVDSEHCALAQCLRSGDAREVRRLVLTASGGPFRGRTRAQLAQVTAQEALAHPTWNMGPKITIDSATLANKALEVIEAHWLFGVDYARIEVLIHPQSLVHGLVEFVDGSFLAQLGPTDMRLPIRHALNWPERRPCPEAALPLERLANLNFSPPDRETFPLLELGLAAGRAGGTAPAVFSAANEEAVRRFLSGALGFYEMAEVVAGALERHRSTPRPDLAAIQAADREAREYVNRRYAC